MQTKKRIRSSKKLENIEKEKEKFPDILLKIINISDIIIEVLDSRFIEETRNREIENLIVNKGKKIIYVLNKSDLIKNKNLNLNPSVFVSAKTKKGIRQLREIIKIESKKVKNNKFNRIQIGVIGYPNTGKSSVINALKSGKSSAKTSSSAGFTKGIQKIKLSSEIILLDSPGVIPKEKYSHTNIENISEHAKVGARDYSKVKEPEIAVSEIMKKYNREIEKFYKIKTEKDSELLLEVLGRQKNILKKGNEVDTDKTARLILKDWQEGKIKL